MWLLPILSGVFIGTSYIPFPPWASLFCFIPLWIFWKHQNSFKAVLLGGWLTSFVFTIIGFNWVAHTLHVFGHLPWGLAIPGMLIFAAIAHLYVPLAGIIWFWGSKKFNWPESLSIAIMALLTTLSEAYSLTLFDWNFGYTWYGSNIPIFQWAEFIGFSGLSAATILSNLLLYHAWIKRKKTSGKLIFLSVLLVFCVLNVGGIWLKNRLPQPDAKFNTLLIQANIGNQEKLAVRLGKGHLEETIDRNLSLTEQSLKSHQGTKIDFILWPEVAFPALLGEQFMNNRYSLALSNFIQNKQIPLITGAFSVDQATRLPTNSLFILNQNGKIVPPHYNKSILLAFGEYIPGEDIWPQIREWIPQTGHFARGSGPTTLLKLNDFKIGPQICYESLFPGFTRSLSQLGAQFIVNVTNDSWYGTWQEPYQHMYMTLARAIEFRRPLLRATNTGISTVVLASGEILELSPLHQEWAGMYSVPYLKSPPATFYQQWFWLIPCLLWFALVVLFVQGIRNR